MLHDLHNANLSAVKIGQMKSVETKSAILDRAAVRRKIRRMALEIAERNTGEKELVIAGIVGNGVVVAQNVAAELQRIVAINITVISIELNKKTPGEVSITPLIDFEDKVVIITDDVADSGKTMFYALKPFLNTHPKKVQTLVLVERSHKRFPIQTDYAGLTIATTLQEHITVEAEGAEISGAWLY